MDPTSTVGTSGITAATPLRIFLRHTSDLGGPGEAGSLVAAVAAVLRARRIQAAASSSSCGCSACDRQFRVSRFQCR